MARRLGISFGGNHLRAVVLDQSRRSAKILAAVEVPLSSPHGTPEDAARLSEALRGKGIASPPPAVVTLPPSWSWLRRIDLPVEDLSRARKIHVQELEGKLPVEGERFLSDLLPAPKGEPRRFLAVASLESVVSGAVSLLASAGIEAERVVTDHVSAYGAFLSLKGGRPGFLCLAVPDLLFLETDRDALLRARHLPAAAAEDGPFLAAEWSSFVVAPGELSPACWRAGVALPPDAPGSFSPLDLPGNLPSHWIPAFGAALLPSYDRETGDFGLRGEEHGASEAVSARRRLLVAVVAGASALLLVLAALATAWWASGRRLALARAALAREFQSAVPGGKVTAGELLQAQGRLQALERQWVELGGDQADPVRILSLLSRSLPAGGSARVKEITLEGERLRVTGEAKESGAVETFRGSLASAFGAGWTITVQESRGSARGEQVTFTVLVEKEGARRAG
jgi:Tfp pilus assembly protein PilN